MTSKDLEEDIFYINHVLTDYARDYIQREIFHQYIPLDATEADSPITNIEETIIEWLKAEANPGCAVVLGDFGAGKTTLMERIKYRLADLYVKHQHTAIPLLFRLRDYNRFPTLDGMLRWTLNRELQQDVPLTTFWNMADKSRLVLLLDGFDEMTPKSDAGRRFDNLGALSRLLTSSSKSIMTCRPAYFVSSTELNEGLKAAKLAQARDLLNFSLPNAVPTKGRARTEHARQEIAAAEEYAEYLMQKFVVPSDDSQLPIDAEAHVLYLSALDTAKIDLYLQGHNDSFKSGPNVDWRAVKEWLYKVYDLSDLIKRPILLAMIIEGIVEQFIDIKADDKRFGPSTLYELYTAMNFAREHLDKKRSLLSSHLRALFSEALALAIYRGGVSEVSYEQITVVITAAASTLGTLRDTLTSATMEQVATDIQLCTFLTRQAEDKFRFTHKSFMEFFAARHIKRLVETDKLPDELLRPLTKEVVYFLASFTKLQPPLWDRLYSWLSTKRVDAGLRNAFDDNIATVLIASGAMVSNSRLSKCAVRTFELKKSVFTSVTLRDVLCAQIRLEELTWVESTFDRIALEGCSLVACEFLRSTIEMTSKNTVFTGLLVRSGVFKLAGVDSSISDVLCDGARVGISGSIRLEKAICQNGADLHLADIELGALTCRDGKALVVAGTTQSVEVQKDSSIEIRQNVVRRIDVISGSVILNNGARVHELNVSGGVVRAEDGTVLEAHFVGGEIFIQKDATLAFGTLTNDAHCNVVGGKVLKAHGKRAKVTMNAGRVQQGEFTDSPFSCTGGELEDCVLSDLTFIGSHSNRTSRVRFNGCSVAVSDGGIVERCTYDLCKISFNRVEAIRQGTFSKCDEIKVEQSQLLGSTLKATAAFGGVLGGISEFICIETRLSDSTIEAFTTAAIMGQEVRNCTFKGLPNLKLSQVKMHDSQFEDCFLAADETVRIDKCTFSKGTKISGERLEVVDSKLFGGRYEVWRGEKYQGCEFRNSAVLLGKGGLVKCGFIGGSLFIREASEVKDIKISGGALIEIESGSANTLEIDGGHYDFSTLRLASECNFNDCDVTFGDACIQKCQFKGGGLHVGVGGKLVDCVLSDVKMNQLRDVELIGTTFERGSYDFSALPTIKKCRFRKGARVKIGKAMLEDCEFDGAAVSMEAGCTLTGCTLTGTSLQRLGPVSFLACTFENFEYDLTDISELSRCRLHSGVTIRFGTTRLEDCEIGGDSVTVSADRMSLDNCKFVRESRLVARAIMGDKCNSDSGHVRIESGGQFSHLTLQSGAKVELMPPRNERCVLRESTLIGATMVLNGNCDANDCDFRDHAAIEIMGTGSLHSVVMSDVSVAIEGFVRFVGCVCERGKFRFALREEAQLDLIDSDLKECSISRSKESVGILKADDASKLNRCSILGVGISRSTLDVLRDVDCNGVVVLDSSGGEPAASEVRKGLFTLDRPATEVWSQDTLRPLRKLSAELAEELRKAIE